MADEDPQEPTTPALDPLRWAGRSPFTRLFEQRIVFLRGPIEDAVADEVVAQLLALDADGEEGVTLLIDSPGGSSYGMFAIHDVMLTMRAPVATRCVGLAASAGAFLLATGTGVRAATPNSRIMLHQPAGGVRGTAADITIQAEQIAYLRRRVDEILAVRTGQPVERISADTARDFWLSAEEARAYGVIDEVVAPSRPLLALA
jgi:ATP-dependent Clp protease, protease subunit